MTLIEALTAKRPEDGKVADWAEGGLEKYKFKPNGDLIRFTPHTDWGQCFAEIDMFTRTDFTPMWETPAPMVPMAGEVWELRLSSIFKAFIHKPKRSTEMKRIWEDGYASELIDDGMIHGQNGWRLVYSPDPERMRRAQNG